MHRFKGGKKINKWIGDYMNDNSSPKGNKNVNENSKNEQLEQFRIKNEGKPLTTNQSRKISNDEDQLKAGVRGPTLR